MVQFARLSRFQRRDSLALLLELAVALPGLKAINPINEPERRILSVRVSAALEWYYSGDDPDECVDDYYRHDEETKP